MGLRSCLIRKKDTKKVGKLTKKMYLCKLIDTIYNIEL